MLYSGEQILSFEPCLVFYAGDSLSKLEDYMYARSKIPSHVYFTVPYITIEQVSEFIHALGPTKATGLDGLGPRVLKMAANMLAPSIASLINKNIETATFPSHPKVAKVFPIYKNGTNLTLQIIGRYLS